MIYACKITDISQTTCILRSVHAHFLQLLRDGALRGRTCRRLTLNIFFFPALLFFGSSFPRGAQRWSKASQEIRPHSVVHLLIPVWRSGNISVLFLPASVMHLSLRLSTLKTFQLCDPLRKHSLLLFLLLFGEGICFVAHLSFVCGGSDNFTDDAERTEGAQTDSERQHIHDDVSWQNIYLCKGKIRRKCGACLSAGKTQNIIEGKSTWSL